MQRCIAVSAPCMWCEDVGGCVCGRHATACCGAWLNRARHWQWFPEGEAQAGCSSRKGRNRCTTGMACATACPCFAPYAYFAQQCCAAAAEIRITCCAIAVVRHTHAVRYSMLLGLLSALLVVVAWGVVA